MKDFYKEIDRVVKEYECSKAWHSNTLEWAADKLAWCAKWRKLGQWEIDNLAERITILFNRGAY